MAQHYIVTAILDGIRRLPGYPRLSVLDLSCGRGELLAALQADGCTVRGTHYRTDDYEANDTRKPSFITPDLRIDSGVDLTATLPYDAAQYDVVADGERAPAQNA